MSASLENEKDTGSPADGTFIKWYSMSLSVSQVTRRIPGPSLRREGDLQGGVSRGDTHWGDETNKMKKKPCLRKTIKSDS